MTVNKMHLSKDLLDPLEELRRERCDKTIATTARVLIKQALASRGLYDMESPQKENGGSGEKPS